MTVFQIKHKIWSMLLVFLAGNSVSIPVQAETVASCVQVGSTCIERAFNGACLTYKNAYDCDSPQSYPDITLIDEQHEIIREEWNDNGCADIQADPQCSQYVDECTVGPETRTIGYMPGITRDCWEKKRTYECGGVAGNDCAQLIADGCTLESTTCYNTSKVDGSCTNYEHTYKCTEPGSGETTTTMDCAAQTFCAGGNCFDTGHPADNDFTKVIAAMESAREAGMYLARDGHIFSGKDMRCRKKLFGLVDCCQREGGEGTSNRAMSQAMGFATDTAGNLIGSSYVHDALFTADAPDIFLDLYGTMYGSGSGFSFGSFYGVTAAIQNGQLVFAFDPTSFAIQIALLLIAELLSCDQDEGLLAAMRDQNLCHGIGSYCSEELDLIFDEICIEKTRTYCCFNSRLAMYINQQGRPQVSKGWGIPENPDCTGFIPEQFGDLNFDQMDLSQFFKEIQPNMPNASAISTKNQDIINQKLLEFY